MIISGNTSKSRRIQEQISPSYIGDLDFNYTLSLLNPSQNLEFGLKSRDGTIRSRYQLISGFVYDYLGRFVSTYQSGLIKFEYGLQSGYVFSSGANLYSSYQKINDRVISLEDIYSGYSTKPFSQFYIVNSSSTDVEFDLSIRGFVPPTLYSNLTGIGNDLFSGNLYQSGLDLYPSSFVQYGLFGINIPADKGSVYSFQASGNSGLSYIISGNNLINGQTIDVEFDTYFGKTTQTLGIYSGVGSTDGGEDSGIYLSLYGDSNFMEANSSLSFQLDYYSNYENDLVVELSGSGSYASTLLSGSGYGTLLYSGYVFKSGLIYSAKYASGYADLAAANNLIWNTDYSLVDTFIPIQGLVSSRSTGTYYTGVNTFTITGVDIVGTYNGPFAPLIGATFSGKGDASFSYEFGEGDQGIYLFNDFAIGTLNSGYSPLFWVNNSPQDSSDANIFPTGEGIAALNLVVTGQGDMVREYEIPYFFGFGSGRTFNSTVEVLGNGTGNINYTGNAHRSIQFDPLDPNAPPFSPSPSNWGGAYALCESYSAVGRVANGLSSFPSVGAPNPPVTTWGYPTGPSKLVIGGTTVAATNLNLPSVTGWVVSSGIPAPVSFAFNGRVTGYFELPGMTLDGPVFPEPRDTGLYPYLGNEFIGVEGNAYYGRGCLFSSGGSDDGTNQFGIYLTDPEGDGFDVSFLVQSGSYNAISKQKVSRVFLNLGQISPAYQSDDGTLIYGGAALEFDNPLIEVQTTGTFQGYAKVPATDLNSKFNLHYSEVEGSLGEDYKANGWFTPEEFIRPTPYQYPADFRRAYIQVDYTTTDTDSFDQALLKVSAGGMTGQVNILTNITNDTGQFDAI